MMRTHITYDGGLFRGVSAFRSIVKAANVHIVHLWHKEMLPGHFKQSATQFYGYAKRTKRYQIQKARTFGHQKPLVWTGTLERNATRDIQVTGTSKRATGRMKGIQALNFASSKPGYPDTRAELTAVHPQEANRLAAEHGKSLADQLNAPGAKRTVTLN